MSYVLASVCCIRTDVTWGLVLIPTICCSVKNRIEAKCERESDNLTPLTTMAATCFEQHLLMPHHNACLYYSQWPHDALTIWYTQNPETVYFLTKTNSHQVIHINWKLQLTTKLSQKSYISLGFRMWTNKKTYILSASLQCTFMHLV